MDLAGDDAHVAQDVEDAEEHAAGMGYKLAADAAV